MSGNRGVRKPCYIVPKTAYTSVVHLISIHLTSRSAACVPRILLVLAAHLTYLIGSPWLAVAMRRSHGVGDSCGVPDARRASPSLFRVSEIQYTIMSHTVLFWQEMPKGQKGENGCERKRICNKARWNASKLRKISQCTQACPLRCLLTFVEQIPASRKRLYISQ